MPARSSPSPSRISAKSAPTPRIHRRTHRRRSPAQPSAPPPPAARGRVIRTAISEPANYRATQSLDQWLCSHNIVGLSGVDTRRLTRTIRDKGAPNGVIAYRADGDIDIAAMREEALAWPGLEGMDLAREVTCRQSYEWTETLWRRGGGYGPKA